MREVFSDSDTARVGLYQSMLESAGIACFIRNFHEGGGFAGNLVSPTLCVIDDSDYPRAREIVLQSGAANAPDAGPDWLCRKCGEEVPGTFDACWKCGAARSA